ncbi:MAG: hypothetical protein IIA33_06460 [Planctomycetes bacterium]|nr:hypothetical protein [Planctomycetota bacterium]
MSAKKSFLLRMPPDLWEDLNRWAKDELRSVNGQIEFLLREATKRRRRERAEEKRKEKAEKRKPTAPPPAASGGGSWSAELD